MAAFRVTLTITGPTRLDRALTDELKQRASHLSRAALKPYFESKRVRLAGRVAPPATVLNPGTHEISIEGWSEAEATEARRARAAETPFLRVVHEDARLLVLDKTTGTPSVPHVPEETDTAVSAALALRPELADVGFGGLEPGLLHRLDTGTSGLLAFAKTTAEFNRLRAAWSTGHVKKTYRALARALPGAVMPALPSELRWLLAHHERSAKRMVAFPDGIRAGSHYRGKPLETVTRLSRAESRDGCTDIELEIETGVMHQIRCTLSTLGWPILGDPLYRGEVSPRLWLHAWRLELPRADGSRLALEAPLPEGWANPLTKQLQYN